jgi:hypothetical protein
MLIRLLKLRSMVWPCLRVLGVLAVLQAGLSAWSLHKARASLDEVILSLGAQLMLYKNARKQSPPRSLVLNGLALQLSTGTSGDPPHAILDQFASMCRARAGKLGRQFPEAQKLLKKQGGEPGLLDGVLRAGDHRRGAVACLDVGTQQLSIQEFVARMARVAESGDFAQLGALRYVTVEGDESGSAFVALWSEDALRLGQAFPEHGDAPGADFDFVPRPAHARRILSAWENQSAQGINVYLTQAAEPEALETYYRHELSRRGFKLLNPSGTKGAKLRGLVAERQGHSVAFSFSKTPEGEGLVSIEPL